jgi:hypothetical protein
VRIGASPEPAILTQPPLRQEIRASSAASTL